MPREDTLDFVPSWYGERILELGEQRCARIGLTGPSMPGVLDDIDPARTGRDQLPQLKEGAKVINDRTTNWTAVPCPTPAWAELVHPDLDEDAAYAKLVEQVLHVCRLDEDDPIAAWKQRMDTLTAVREKLTARRFDAVRFRGPGTDLTVGLLPSSIWLSAGDFTTVDGIVHMPNLPSEEVFSCPDPRADRGRRALDQAARRQRLDHPRPGGRVPRRPRRADRRRRGRGRPARLRGARRGRVTPRRGRRSSTARAASARWTPSSSTRCWTRTPPATSRSGRPTRSPPARRTTGASTAPRSTSTS